MNRPEIVGRGQQVGIVIASGVVSTTFTGSLSERSWRDQGLITGLATGTHILLTCSPRTPSMLPAAPSRPRSPSRSHGLLNNGRRQQPC